MKLSSYIFVLCSFVSFLVLFGCQIEDYDLFSTLDDPTEPISPLKSNSQFVPDQYIVLLQEEYVETLDIGIRSSGELSDGQQAPRDVANSLDKATYNSHVEIVSDICEGILSENRISSDNLLKAFTGIQTGMVVNLSSAEKDQLTHDPRIGVIEQDQLIALSIIEPNLKTPFNPSGNNGNGAGATGQITPLGVTRVGGTLDFEANSQYNYRWAWILDTGVDGHSELNVVNNYSANFSSDPNKHDGYGHGTHVAGIVAAKDNSKGVVGVAAGAYVVNIKVLNSQGIGYSSDVVAALNYISNFLWQEDVINMSIGGPVSNMVDNAVLGIANMGVKVVVSSGNDSQDVSANSPARVSHPNILVISSIDDWDTFSSYSNYGGNVDFVAPGDYVMSTYGSTQYAYLTGTSMAAPHATGVLLCSPSSYNTNGVASQSPDGRTYHVISR